MKNSAFFPAIFLFLFFYLPSMVAQIGFKAGPSTRWAIAFQY